jgi:ABC-type glycerol-3-phosphate transport system permease component
VKSLISSKRMGKAISHSITYFFLVMGAFLLMIPLVWMLSTSLKEPGDVLKYPPEWIPNPVRWSNYVEAMTQPYAPFGIFLKNTLIKTVFGMLGQLLSASMVAFSFARLRWSGRDVLFLVVLATLMLPYQVTMIPVFILMKNLGWVDTLLPLIVPFFFGGGAFYIFLFRQFMMTIPLELDDAAKIDGCTTFGLYARIILPLSRPVLVTASIFSFLAHWNDFIGPLIYLNSTENYTLSLGLRILQGYGGYGIQRWHLLMAASLMVMAPVLALFFFAQRYFIQGVVVSKARALQQEDTLMKESMTPRERYLAVLRRQEPDRIPLEWRATREVEEMMMRHFDCSLEQVLARLHIDPVVNVGPRYVGPPIAPGYDMHGCRHRQIVYETGSYDEVVSHPLAQYNSVQEIQDGYTWPTVDWFDFEGIPDQVKGKEMYPVRGGGSEPFLTYKSLRGMEQAYIDMVEHPDIVHYCLDKLFGLRYESTRRTYEQLPHGTVHITYVAEDMGSQTSLLFSPAAIREFLLPRMKRMMDLAHSAGAYVFLHSDGAVRPILADFIDAGVDVLDPVQWRCQGMEREGLKRDFGDDLIFHGAVDNQYTLAFGSVQEVRDEVQENIRILGQGGGYIIAPCHNIQPVSSPENVVAMYETGYECGWT